MTPLQSLVASGTKLWLDSVDPDEIARNRALGATGATSNPIIIADIVKTGRLDSDIQQLLKAGQDNETIAWALVGPGRGNRRSRAGWRRAAASRSYDRTWCGRSWRGYRRMRSLPVLSTGESTHPK